MSKLAWRGARFSRDAATLFALLGASAVAADTAFAQLLRLGTTAPALAAAPAGEFPDPIGTVVSDARGGLYVLYQRTGRLTYLAPSTTGASYTTAATLSPLKLADPRNLVVRGPGRVGVLDYRAGTINTVARMGATFGAADTVRLTGLTHVTGLCAIGDRTFAMGIDGEATDGGALVHVFGPNRQRAGDFGTHYSTDPLAREVYSVGRLLCSPDRRQVIATSRFFPEIRAYTAAGTLAWSRVIRPFQAMQVEASARSARYVLAPDSVYHEVVSVFDVDRATIAVQVSERRGVNPRVPPRRLSTLFYRVSDGTELGTQTDLPLVVAASRTHLFSLSPGITPAVLMTPFTRLAH